MNMKPEQKLRQYIREILQEELDEISTSAGAGAYLTPMAFRGNKQNNVAKMKHTATQLGYTLTPKGSEDLTKKADKLVEAKMRYHEYKKDESASPHKKIARAIVELNKSLNEADRVLNMNTRLKNESGITSEQLWKRTQQGLLKLESKLITIAGKIRELRGN